MKDKINRDNMQFFWAGLFIGIMSSVVIYILEKL